MAHYTKIMAKISRPDDAAGPVQYQSLEGKILTVGPWTLPAELAKAYQQAQEQQAQQHRQAQQHQQAQQQQAYEHGKASPPERLVWGSSSGMASEQFPREPGAAAHSSPSSLLESAARELEQAADSLKGEQRRQRRKKYSARYPNWFRKGIPSAGKDSLASVIRSSKTYAAIGGYVGSSLYLFDRFGIGTVEPKGKYVLAAITVFATGIAIESYRTWRRLRQTK